jgi:steroid 5-alpha reductase family enzyme
MGLLPLAATSALAVLAVMLGGWLVSLRRRDASLVDVLWGAQFALVAWLGLLLGAGDLFRRLLVAVLATLWGLRLSLHIARRSRGRGEDYRYRAMRERHGDRFGRRSLVTVFLLQAAILLVVAAPLLVVGAVPGPAGPGGPEAAGAAVWLAGFLLEAIADAQLTRFRADPARRGRVMDRGLWRYSRHPNYFGDALLWWGFWLIACAVPGGVWTAFSPALMTFLLVRVSGVTLLEQGLAATKPGYRDYVARTSAFVPWRPRRAADGSRSADGDRPHPQGNQNHAHNTSHRHRRPPKAIGRRSACLLWQVNLPQGVHNNKSDLGPIRSWQSPRRDRRVDRTAAPDDRK